MTPTPGGGVVPPAAEGLPDAIKAEIAASYHPDRVRARLGYALFFLLTATIAFLAIEVALGKWDQAREFAEIIVPLEVTLLSGAIGFYYGRNG